MKIYTLKDGEKFVKAARNAIELYIKSPHFDKHIVEKTLSEYKENVGVFVTIEHYPTLSLRGCIGFPEAVGPLKNSLVEASIAAATEDPRFMPLSAQELNEVVIEVSILTEPQEINGKTQEEKKKEIKIGRDGLIIEYGFYSGLLLPIVPVEEHWSVEEFLENTCEKAGLQKDFWKRSNAVIYKFQSQVFKEKEPNGSVVEIKMEKE
ncbi:MAG: TIGR00296 family protein [Candidatus Micrarchaeia archaeon]